MASTQIGTFRSIVRDGRSSASLRDYVAVTVETVDAADLDVVDYRDEDAVERERDRVTDAVYGEWYDALHAIAQRHGMTPAGDERVGEYGTDYDDAMEAAADDVEDVDFWAIVARHLDGPR